MPVPPTSSLLALLLPGVLACAGVDDEAPPADAAREEAPARPDASPSSTLNCAVTQTVTLVPRPADVLLLLDRSGSMDLAFGAGTRYQALAALLGDLVSAHAQHVRFGYQEFPGRSGCEGPALPGCCVSPPAVGVADDNAALVLAAIASAGPMDGSTPTAAALRVARQYYDGLSDGVDTRSVLLATDGAPDCPGAGGASGADPAGACAEATAEVAGLVAAGVRVIVLGVGLDSGADPMGESACLDALAHAGGAAASPGSPGYYTAADAERLALAIEQLFGGDTRPSCTLRFPGELEDTSAVALYLDGQQIPRTSPNGWRLDLGQSPPVARVTGSYCEAIETFQVHAIEARYTCPICIECRPPPGGPGDAGGGTIP